MNQATPTKFSMLFKHNYGKLFWKFGDHSFNFSFVHGSSWSRVLESIHRFGVIFTFCKKSSKGHCEAMVDVKKICFTDFKGICMNFLLELIFFVLSQPVTTKQPQEIVQIHLGHPVFPLLNCALCNENLNLVEVWGWFHIIFENLKWISVNLQISFAMETICVEQMEWKLQFIIFYIKKSF